MNNGKVTPFTSVNTRQMQSIGPSKNIVITSNGKKLNNESNKYTGKGVSIEVSTNVTHAGDNRFENIENQDAEKWSSYLDTERTKNEEKAQTRSKIIKSIIQNEANTLSWIDLFFYPLVIVLISFLFMVPFCLFPAHDLVKNPEFWYEFIFHNTYYAIAHSLFWTYLAGSYLNMSYFYNARPLLISSFIATLTVVLVAVLNHYIWTIILSYQYPIPWGGAINFTVVNIAHILSIWFVMPKGLRNNEKVKKQMKVFLVLNMSYISIVFVYQILAIITMKFRGPYQPLIALIFPITRELGIWLLTKMVEKCAHGDERKGLTIMFFQLSVNHSITVCYVVGSLTDDYTSWVLMGFDFLQNIYLCLRVVRTDNDNTATIEHRTNLLQDLATSELVEFYSPLAFMLATSMSYFTPIGAIVGNVSNGYWNYNAIDDIGKTITKMAVFFLVDFASTIVSATILWSFCKINLLKVFAEIQKEFFKGFSFILGFLILAVR